ncbi:hypothetical protein [Cupriavidus sp. DL-D2]|uniref:hypothetical protein n=1 Tax=Cupriavidus sp. DL-D2 TaxID=3144974 RepID=UPI003213CB82
MTATLRTQPWRVAAVFGPLEAVIAQIEQTGTVTANAQGMPIFKDGNDGCWYATVPAIEGIVDAYHTHQVRCGRTMPLDRLRQFARKLEYSSPLTLADCEAVREDIAVLRRETMSMRIDYASSLVTTTQIKIELQEQERSAACRPQ